MVNQIENIVVPKKHKRYIKLGCFLIILSFLCTLVSVIVVGMAPKSKFAWIKGILLYCLGWMLLLAGGFVTGRYSFKYILEFFNRFRRR